MKCPECGSSDLDSPDDLHDDAIGILECQQCGFADLADAFDNESGEG